MTPYLITAVINHCLDGFYYKIWTWKVSTSIILPQQRYWFLVPLLKAFSSSLALGFSVFLKATEHRFHWTACFPLRNTFNITELHPVQSVEAAWGVSVANPIFQVTVCTRYISPIQHFYNLSWGRKDEEDNSNLAYFKEGQHPKEWSKLLADMT